MGAGTAAAVQIVLALLDRAAQIGALISTAQAEKRDITTAELDALIAQDDAAKARLDAAIAKARAGG